MCVADIARQHAQIPVHPSWQREEEVGFRVARPERGDAAVRRAEELPRVTERMPQRLVRFAGVFQMSGQAVDELQRGELPLYRQHGASGWFSNQPGVKCVPVGHHSHRPGQVIINDVNSQLPTLDSTRLLARAALDRGRAGHQCASTSGHTRRMRVNPA